MHLCFHTGPRSRNGRQIEERRRFFFSEIKLKTCLVRRILCRKTPLMLPWLVTITIVFEISRNVVSFTGAYSWEGHLFFLGAGGEEGGDGEKEEVSGAGLGDPKEEPYVKTNL